MNHKELEIMLLKKDIARVMKDREDRKWQFEQWDKNSENLIKQYKREIEVLENQE